jgi:2-methylisocitrate lyase-like PEP mutase family enzyme
MLRVNQQASAGVSPVDGERWIPGRKHACPAVASISRPENGIATAGVKRIRILRVNRQRPATIDWQNGARISRLQAFEKAGADVLFAPGLPDLAAVRAVCAAVAKPVNFMVGIEGKSFSVGELAAAGVRRISLATSLYRAAMTGLLDAAYQVRDAGQFGFLDRCVTTPELNQLMRI